MDPIKVFVRADNMATIVCPSCKRIKNIAVGAFKDKNHDIKVRCPCNTTFTIRLDFRAHYRKPTDLPGTYIIIKPPDMGGGAMRIKDISLGGIGFTISGESRISKGQTLCLEFILDDKKKTRLKKQVIVQSINNNFVGCRFIDKDLFEKALGFYLRA